MRYKAGHLICSLHILEFQLTERSYRHTINFEQFGKFSFNIFPVLEDLARKLYETFERA